jgi:ATP-dependent DNA helicase RecG
MLVDALRQVVGALRKSSLIEGLFRRDILEYPELALREALVNAIAHRDYSSFARASYIQIRLFSDRIEIQSPGGLYGTVTIENLDTEQSTRNKSLMRMLEDLGLSENRGSGVPAMIGAMRAAHLTPPQFEDKRSSFWVTFRNHTLLSAEAVDWLNSFSSYQLNDNQRMAILLTRQNGSITNRDYRALCNVDVAAATRELRGLFEQGIFSQHGTGRWTSYSLNLQAPTKQVERPAVSEAEASILRFATTRGRVTNSDVQDLLGVNRTQASRLLARLRDAGWLVASGSGRWTVYSIPA